MSDEVEYSIMVPPVRAYQQPERFVLPSYYEVDEKTAGLGKGAFGSVIAAVDKRTGKSVAIKKCIDVFNDGRHTGTLRELILLHHFSEVAHPNIVRLLDFFIESSETVDTYTSVYLAMERYDKSLKGVLRTEEDLLMLTELRRCALIKQLLVGLQAVHRAGFIHRDIKPENLLIRYEGDLDTEVNLAICDFGSGRDMQANSGDPTTLIPLVTTMSYMPPEGIAQVLEEARRGGGNAYHIIKQGTLGSTERPQATEIWGVACIMWELITGEPLIYSEKGVPQEMVMKIAQVLGRPPSWMAEKITNESLKRKVMAEPERTVRELLHEGGYLISPDNPDGCSEQELDLVAQMLVYDPAQRVSIDAALEHKFFDQLGDCFRETPTQELRSYTDDIHHKMRSDITPDEARQVVWDFVHTAGKVVS